MYTYTYITYMYIYNATLIHILHICIYTMQCSHTQCNAHNSTSGLSTLVLQDLLLIKAVLMSSQTAKKLRIYIYIYIYIYIM